MAGGVIGEGRLSVSRIWSDTNNYRAAFVFGFAALGCWMPLFNLWLEDRGVKGIYIGYIASIPWIVMLIVQPLWGMLADKLGKKRCFDISLIMAALLSLLLPLTTRGKLSLAGGTFLFAVFQTPVLPLLDSLTLDYTTDKDRSITYTHLRFWGAPGFAIGALLTGFLIPAWGVDTAFYLSAVFLMITFLFARLFGTNHSLVPLLTLVSGGSEKF